MMRSAALTSAYWVIQSSASLSEMAMPGCPSGLITLAMRMQSETRAPSSRSRVTPRPSTMGPAACSMRPLLSRDDEQTGSVWVRQPVLERGGGQLTLLDVAENAGHVWRDTRGPGSACERCGLYYSQWAG